MAINKYCVTISLAIGFMCFSFSGCADIAVRSNGIYYGQPTEEEITVKIRESNCTDLNFNQNNKNSLNTSEYLRFIKVYRSDLNNKKCMIVCTGGLRLSDDERKLKCKNEIDAEISRQRLAKERKNDKIAEKKAVAKAKTDKMYSDLAAKGYTKISIDDFQLDADSLPNGKKVYIEGFYEVFGEIQYLVRIPTAGYQQQQYQIPLLSEDADRETRKRLIKIQQSCTAGQSACQITVIGKVTPCKVSFFSTSKNKTCINIDTFFVEQ